VRKIDLIVFHCSDSTWGDRDAIDKWHQQRGWSGIGYHYVILNGFIHSNSKYDQELDGIIQTGRPLKSSGAHVRGLNKHSIGICLIGKHHFTSAQLLSVRELMKQIRKELQCELKVKAHYELDDKKTCPNINANLLRMLAV